jgi:subtilisin
MTRGPIEISRRNVLKAVGVSLGTGLLASPVAANADVRVFAYPRRGHDVQVAVEEQGGSLRAYDNFEFVAAQLPAKSLTAFQHDDRIAGIELDGIVSALPVQGERARPRNRRNGETKWWTRDGQFDATWRQNSRTDGTWTRDGWFEEFESRMREARSVETDVRGSRSSQKTSWGYIDIAADSAHDLGVTGEGVDIAVLDTGVDTRHSDLRIAGGIDCTDWWPWSTDYDDDNGHGTHCAGIATAHDNGNGVVGVAPDANLYAVKVLGNSASGFWSDAIQGIDWCISNRIPIISMSLGGDSIPSALRDSLQRAVDNGHLVVAAAGNRGNDGDGDCDERNVDAPARNRNVLAVGASTSDGDVATFSSVGRRTELTAPGTGIYSTYKGNSYATMSGTSMAAPHVAGVAALVWQAAGYGKPSGDEGARVRDVLTSTATEIDGTCDEGHGLVDAYEAVRAVR